MGGLFSSDRFRVLRSLECLREVCKKEGNDEILHQYVKLNVYKRICELLTISDIMLLIYTLECLLSMTGLGEAVCNELSRVQGSVASLVSLVTVEVSLFLLFRNRDVALISVYNGRKSQVVGGALSTNDLRDYTVISV